MEWHYTHTGDKKRHESFGVVAEYISRGVLLHRLYALYNLDKKGYFMQEIILPSSKAKVSVVMHNFAECLQNLLLTDPRITDEDYLFFGDDPFTPPPPPKNNPKIGDINTGQGFVELTACLRLTARYNRHVPKCHSHMKLLPCLLGKNSERKLQSFYWVVGKLPSGGAIDIEYQWRRH
eukprot:CAMPEP_0178793768 /NCGR_PEP_ID=MMETSP0745-20121128/9237_1 /TAXON_ID=913974 /ORGANISM="Nitzschia punctata, Strain CCMP561" /LENGTH=177 /DNA_ID=CAMNT_0020452053 /DNA_START=9 /DNA_END=542 /DNA_ORIENTATION=-